MTDYLSDTGWQSVLQKNKGKITDNGLLATLTKYRKLPEEKYPERLKELKDVFQLGLKLNNTSVKVKPPPDVADYLMKMGAASIKMQNDITADMKAAAVSASEKIMLGNMVIEAAHNATTNAKANALFFGRQVIAACTAFQVYSKEKIDSLDGDMSAADLLGPLVSVVTGGVSNALMAGVVDPIAKKVAAEMTKLAESKIKSGLSSVGSTSKDLEKAVKVLILGATDAATAMESVVTRIVMPQFKLVVDGVNSGKRLSDELTAVIEPFIRKDGPAVDTLLERRFGLPTPAKSKQTQLQIYKKMVERFEVIAIKAATPSGEKMEWVITGVPPSVQRKAEERAKQAGHQRETAIGKKEQEAGL